MVCRLHLIGGLGALLEFLRSPLWNKKGAKFLLSSFIFFCRDDWIRTSDHTPPRRFNRL